MQHFLEISQLTPTFIESLLDKAFAFKKNASISLGDLQPFGGKHQQRTSYQKPLIRPAGTFSPFLGRREKRRSSLEERPTVATLFYENSTRTRLSFQLAAQRLSMPYLDLGIDSSSESKGEVIEDTVKTLVAMGVHQLIIRHKEAGLPAHLAQVIGQSAHIINAGDGTHAHPSQALLDMMTIKAHFSQLENLKIAVLGNVKHSRVANSFQWICSKLGVGELVFIAPALWQPSSLAFGRVTDDLQEGLSQADIIMCLRVQKERLLADEQLDLNTYRESFALTKKSIAYAKQGAWVMHPGPMNRGIEIDSEIADGPQSLIWEQVTNGVFARMAILDALS